MIKIIDGDLLASTTDIIAHQVNCKGAFNSGVARAIREYDVQVFHDYRAYCSSKTADDLIGDVRYFQSDMDDKIYANLFAQKSYGYDGNPDFANDFDLMFDQRIIEFCEKRLEPLWSEKVYKGRESYAFRCGFAGAGYIREIDTSRVWNLRHNNVDAPIINYVEVSTNKYGYLSVL